MREFREIIPKEFRGKRIKDFLIEGLQMSRRMIKSIRWNGKVYLNDEEAMLWYPLAEGDLLYVQTDLAAEKISLHFPKDQAPVWQNHDLVVMSKKAPQVVHPTFNSELEDLCTLISDVPLHPVQRLDKGTSGLVIIALNPYAHYRLSQSPIKRIYMAISHGLPESKEGIIDAAIARRAPSIIERYVAEHGKPSRTKYKVLQHAEEANLSLLQFELVTGRTHQIRVHSQYMGHPLLGDTLYGFNSEKDQIIERQALHAYHLEFNLPETEERIVLNDPLPPDMQSVLDRYNFQELA